MQFASEIPLNQKILAALKEVSEQKVKDVTIQEYTPLKDGDKEKHQFAFFVKPEVTTVADGVLTGPALDMMTNMLEAAGVEFGAIRILSGSYLDEKDIMVQHYGVISNISKNGTASKNFTADANKKLQEKFADELAAGVVPQGAHQFIAENPAFNAESLLTLNDNLGTTRLAGGTYMMKMNFMGATKLILNPFHPYQLVPYTTPGHAIIVFECKSTMSWEDLRNNLCGVTKPEKAASGSIRSALLSKYEEFKMASCDQGTNGCHMSAGPIEAMVELRRFFDLKTEETCFGALLATKCSAEQIESFADNVDVVSEGKEISSWDLTEEVDAAKSLELLAASTSA
jgi:hypothetical protein